MKKNYIIPNTESVAFHAGSLCDVSAGGSGLNINGPAIGGGSGASTIGDPD